MGIWYLWSLISTHNPLEWKLRRGENGYSWASWTHSPNPCACLLLTSTGKAWGKERGNPAWSCFPQREEYWTPSSELVNNICMGIGLQFLGRGCLLWAQCCDLNIVLRLKHSILNLVFSYPGKASIFSSEIKVSLKILGLPIS